MNSHNPLGYLKHKLWPKEKSRLKVENGPDYLHASGVLNIVGKLLMRVTTLLKTSLQLKICTKNYGPPKLQETQFREFQNSQLRILEVSRQNDI
jgi:hypothetical protein